MLKRGNSGDSQVRDKKNLSKGILNRNLKKPDNYQLSTLRKALCNEGKHYVRLNPKKRKDLSIPCWVYNLLIRVLLLFCLIANSEMGDLRFVESRVGNFGISFR